MSKTSCVLLAVLVAGCNIHTFVDRSNLCQDISNFCQEKVTFIGQKYFCQRKYFCLLHMA